MILLRDLICEQFDPKNDIMKRIRESINYIAGEFAESSPQLIGRGYYGFAYKLASGRIMKITADTSEVTTAMRRRHVVPHLMSYYDVRAIVPAGASIFDLYNTRFVLLMDAVTPLTDDQGEIWNRMKNFGYFNPDIASETIQARFDASPGLTYMANQDLEFMRAAFDQRQNIIKTVRRYNIRAVEAHGGNVGIDAHGRITIFDMQSQQYSSKMNPNTVRVNRNVSELVRKLPNIELDSSKFDATGIKDSEN